MKKKLLITLGCSFTEGVGCYTQEIIQKGVPYYEYPPKEKSIILERFHELGWPNRVGKKLGYDKVLNLGIGGSSNSAHLKVFTAKIIPKISQLKEEYSLSLIWMLTEPTRFSFYSEADLISFSPSIGGKDLEKSYINTFTEFTIGPMRELKFLVTVGEHLFKSLEIDYLITSINENWILDFKRGYSSHRFLCPYNPAAEFDIHNKKLLSSICSHPNEQGYEAIANDIVSKVKRYHPHLDSGKSSDCIDWEWDGVLGRDRSFMF